MATIGVSDYERKKAVHERLVGMLLPKKGAPVAESPTADGAPPT